MTVLESYCQAFEKVCLAFSAATNFSAGIPLMAVRSLNSMGRDPQASVAKTLWIEGQS